MQLLTEELVLRTVTEDDVNEIARMRHYANEDNGDPLFICEKE